MFKIFSRTNGKIKEQAAECSSKDTRTVLALVATAAAREKLEIFLWKIERSQFPELFSRTYSHAIWLQPDAEGNARFALIPLDPPSTETLRKTMEVNAGIDLRMELIDLR